MVLGAIAFQVLGAISAKTVPAVLDYLNDRVKTVLDQKSSKGKKELESLQREVEELKRQLQAKAQVNADDVRTVENQVLQACRIQAENGLDMISDQTHLKWLWDKFDRLSITEKGKTTFNVKVWTEEGTSATPRDINIVPVRSATGHRIGDKITIYFKSDRDCYLNLFNLGTSGKITLLFPNGLFPDNFIKANSIYAFPGEGYPFKYILSGPPGRERIKAIATGQKMSFRDLDTTKDEGIFHSAERSAAARDITIVEERIQKLSPVSWSADAWEFTLEG